MFNACCSVASSAQVCLSERGKSASREVFPGGPPFAGPGEVFVPFTWSFAPGVGASSLETNASVLPGGTLTGRTGRRDLAILDRFRLAFARLVFWGDFIAHHQCIDFHCVRTRTAIASHFQSLVFLGFSTIKIQALALTTTNPGPKSWRRWS